MKINTILLLISLLLSMKTLLLGQLHFEANEKEGFLPLKAKVVFLVFLTLSLVSRIVAFLGFFIPSLGLFGVQNHVTLGEMPVSIGYQTQFYDAKPINETHFEAIRLQTVWEPINFSSDFISWLKFGTMYIWFLVLQAIQLSLALALCIKVTPGFTALPDLFNQALDVVSLWVAPTPFRDWDALVRQGFTSDFVVAFNAMKREIVAKVIWFSLCNLEIVPI